MNKSTLSDNTEERSGKRRKVAAFLLAAVAIGGIGAGLTSAAWTDNTFFSASAAAATFNLQGSVDGTTWVESDNESTIALQIPADRFANLLPGQTRTVEVSVKNDSSVAATLTTTPTWTASTFVAAPTVTVSSVSTPLGAGATQKLTVTVKADDDWAVTNKGKTGTLIVKVGATATAN